MKRIRPFVVVAAAMGSIVGAYVFLLAAARPAMEYRERVGEIESLRQEAFLTKDPVVSSQVLVTIAEELNLLKEMPWFGYVRKTVGQGDINPVAIQAFQAAFQLEDWCRAGRSRLERLSREDLESERLVKELRAAGWSSADTLLSWLTFFVFVGAIIFFLFMSPSDRRRWLYGKETPAPPSALPSAPAPAEQDCVPEDSLT